MLEIVIKYLFVAILDSWIVFETVDLLSMFEKVILDLRFPFFPILIFLEFLEIIFCS